MTLKEQWYNSMINDDEETYIDVDQRLTTIISEYVEKLLNNLDTDRTISDFFEYVGDFIGHYVLIRDFTMYNDKVWTDRLCLLVVQFLTNNEHPTTYIT